jgi:hypothetical protein
MEFYRRMIWRGLIETNTTSGMNLYWWMGIRFNFNTRVVDRQQLDFLFRTYRERVDVVKADPEERRFRKALSYKDQGILISRLPRVAQATYDAYFDTAMSLLRQVSPAYLQTTTSAQLSRDDKIQTRRRNLFIFPDIRPESEIFEPRSFVFYHFSNAFMRYIVDKGLVKEFYATREERREVEAWIEAVNVTEFSKSSFFIMGPSRQLLHDLDSSLPADWSAGGELNLLRLLEGRAAQKEGDTSAMLQAYGKLVLSNLQNVFSIGEFGGNARNHAFSLIGYAMRGYLETGHDRQAMELVNRFKNPVNRASLYAFAASELSLAGSDTRLVDRMIDSARRETERGDRTAPQQPNRAALVMALALRDRPANRAEIDRLIKNLQEKALVLANVGRADAFRGRLYEARM